MTAKKCQSESGPEIPDLELSISAIALRGSRVALWHVTVLPRKISPSLTWAAGWEWGGAHFKDINRIQEDSFFKKRKEKKRSQLAKPVLESGHRCPNPSFTSLSR